MGANWPLPLATDAPQWDFKAVGMMHALGVAGDLGADHAGRVGIIFRAAHAADGVVAENLDFERAGRRAIVRAGGSEEAGADGLVH